MKVIRDNWENVAPDLADRGDLGEGFGVYCWCCNEDKSFTNPGNDTPGYFLKGAPGTTRPMYICRDCVSGGAESIRAKFLDQARHHLDEAAQYAACVGEEITTVPEDPKCLEKKVEFSEVQSSKLNRFGGDLGIWTGAKRGFVSNLRHAGRIRGEESLRAVASCYRWTSGKFGRVEQAADGKYADCYDVRKWSS